MATTLHKPITNMLASNRGTLKRNFKFNIQPVSVLVVQSAEQLVRFIRFTDAKLLVRLTTYSLFSRGALAAAMTKNIFKRKEIHLRNCSYLQITDMFVNGNTN